MRMCWLTVKNFHLKRRRKTNRILGVMKHTHKTNNGRTCRSENAEVMFPFWFFASVFSSNIFFFLLVPLGTGTLLCTSQAAGWQGQAG